MTIWPERLAALRARLWAGQTLAVAAKGLGISYETARGLIRRHGMGEPVEPQRPGCEWIETDGPPWRRCGQPVARPGLAWCVQHLRRVYVRRGDMAA